MTQLSNRTTYIIAAEINSIKEQTRQIMLQSSIEIGRRLHEAKGMLPHGEWGPWLKESIDYSQSTANNLMKIFEQYGSDQLTLFGDNAKSQALGNLSYSQAVALLGIPEEEREQFVQVNDLDNMSTRELQQAIKEKQALEKQLQVANEKTERERMEREKVESSLAEMQMQNNMNYELAESYKAQIDEAEQSGNDEEASKLQAEFERSQTALSESSKKIKELEEQLKSKPIDIPVKEIIEKVPEEIEKELVQLRELVKRNDSKAMAKFAVFFETIVKDFDNLLGALYEIKTSAPEQHEKYQKAVAGLINRMSEKV